MPRLEWRLVTVDELEPTCGAARGRSGKVRCELPTDHVIGRDTSPFTAPWHTGRDVLGRWLVWTGKAADAS